MRALRNDNCYVRSAILVDAVQGMARTHLSQIRVAESTAGGNPVAPCVDSHPIVT
jgi:hypothetical protein